MTTDTKMFPVTHGLAGMNKLAMFLNASNLAGGWHFSLGSRFDQAMVGVDFDDPADSTPTWRRYCDAVPAN